MGKIRVRTLGEEGLEQKQKNKAKQKGKEKKFVKGAKGGERIVSVGPTAEEIAKIELPKESIEETPLRPFDSAQGSEGQAKEVKLTAKKFKKEKKAPHSKSYQAAAKTLDKSKKYSLLDGLSILEKLKRSPPAGGFDETVELHINTIETGVSGNITLPHGTGKTVRVAIADPTTTSGQVALDELLKKVESGVTDFDVLLATPTAMPKLAKVAKILGPRGLMPNPKNGTLTKDPEKLAASFTKGQMNFKTEAKAPIMHLTVGKMSFGAKKLSDNIQTLLDAIQKEKIRNITLKSTMSPGIKIGF